MSAGGRSRVVVAVLALGAPLLVGVVLAALGLTPLGLVRYLAQSVEHLFGFGWKAVEDVGRYVLTGAVIVIPLWLLSRLIGARR